MAPDIIGSSTIFFAKASIDVVHVSPPNKQISNNNIPTRFTRPHQQKYKWDIVWFNVIGFIYLHYAAICGLYSLFTDAKASTVYIFIICSYMNGLGITAGAHRLWAHKTYKANAGLTIFLMICQSLAFQNHIYEWVRDHRVHHKFTDTNADPHNARRGFFFSHMGWLLIKKHDDVKQKGKTVDMSDLEHDPIVMFQRKYYMVLMPVFCFMLPTLIPWYFWDENLMTAFYCCVFRYIIALHFTWLVNSAAHIFGNKPYDKYIAPRENKLVSALAFGEGFHNYHHVFPWDYKAAELGFSKLNITTGFINLWAKLGWAWDLKTVSREMILKRALRTGDGTWVSEDEAKIVDDENASSHEGDNVWGWGDKDMSEEDIHDVKIYNKLIDA